MDFNDCIDIDALDLELEDKNLEIMKDAYLHNLKITREEIELNRKLLDYVCSEIVIPKKNVSIVTKTKNKEVIPLRIDVDDIYNKISNVSDINLLRDILNTVDNKDEVLNVIILKYIKELKIIEKFCLTDPEELFTCEYNNLSSRINLLMSLKNESINEINHLIYLKNYSNNPTIFKSIENNITNENYELLDGLFCSIEDGTFKNNKLINKGNSSYSYTFSEVKDDQLRITYMKLKNNLYLILDCFTKKFQTSSIYKTNIESSLKSYQRQKDIINELLNNEEFIKENDDITLRIHEILRQKKKVKNG